MIMEILMQPNARMLTLLGEPGVFSDQDYRFMKYCLMTDIDNGKLIFNGLTRSLIFLRNDEITSIGNINNYEFLYKNYFLVSEDFDEQQVVDEMREKLRKPIDTVYLDHPQTFTILTTTRCNARCFYCYEMKSKHKHHMTEETAHKVSKYIASVTPKGKQIFFNWFGGEPLFNMKVIDIITQETRDAGIKFTSSFTSNGYLFDKDLVLKAKNIWNTNHVQITIDGTEEVYNKTKNYIHKDASPYKRVLNNIAMLLNNGIGVSVRLNLDFYNADNLKLLCKELHNRFKNHPSFSVYAWPIFENDDYVRTKEEHIGVFEKLRELEEVMNQYGYIPALSPKPELVYVQCMADDGNSVTISPDGDLGTCEHLIDRNFWGHIDNPYEKNYDNLYMWRDYNKPLDICYDCPIYPSCIRPAKCLEMGKCDEQYKEWRIRRHTYGIIYSYKRYKGHYNNNMPRKLAENVK